jgi:integrase/recombinase XerC
MLQEKVISSYCISLEALGRAPRTISTNKERLVDLQKFLDRRGVNEIEEINPELIDLYISSSYRKGLSIFTVAGRIQVLKAFFGWSVKRNYLLQSPAAHLKKPRLNHQASDKAILQEDLAAMILFARHSKKEIEELALMIFADTGCRTGELCGISIGDIDFENNEILVDGKTGKRLLDFTEKTSIVLKSYIASRGTIPYSSQALFLNNAGKQMTMNQIYMRFRKIAGKLDIKRFNPQSIRHRVGQGWLDQGANLELVRQKLGHKDIQTTALYYSHQDRTRSKIATKKFSIVKSI